MPKEDFCEQGRFLRAINSQTARDRQKVQTEQQWEVGAVLSSSFIYSAGASVAIKIDFRD